MSIKTINGLPLYEAQMGAGCGVLQVSLVDAPAVDANFNAYAAQKEVKVYEITDEEKRRVFGVVLRADYPIYRRGENDEEYYIIFRAEQIRAFAQQYLAEGRQNNVDLDHDFKTIDGAQMVQYFIKDSEKGLAPSGFDEIADGSLFAEYQIVDDALWERIKSGEFKGFSAEIIHAEVPVTEYHKQKTNMKKTLFEALVDLVAAYKEEQKTDSFKSVATDKGTLEWDGTEDLKAGDKVYALDADGNRVDVADGDYTTEDGKIISVEGNEVKEIRDKEAEVAPTDETKPAEPETNAEETPAEGAEDKDAKIAKLEAKIKEQEDALAAKDAEIADKDAKIAELEAKIAESPAGEDAHAAYRKQAGSLDKTDENFVDLYKRLKR